MRTLLLRNGDWFTAYINGDKVSGRVRVIDNRRYFLCQNVADGARCTEDLRYGYKYSWVVEDYEKNTEEADVYGVKIFKKEPKNFTFNKDIVSKVTIGQYGSLIYPKRLLKIGCTFVSAAKVAEIVEAVGRPSKKAVTKFYAGEIIESQTINVDKDYSKGVIVYKGVGLRIKNGSDIGEIVPVATIKLVGRKMNIKTAK